MSEWPEHDKLEAVKDESHLIGSFLEWLETYHETPQGKLTGMRLCNYDSHAGTWHPTHVHVERLLARYFGVDLNALDREKRAMLELIRARNDNARFGLEATRDVHPDAAEVERAPAGATPGEVGTAGGTPPRPHQGRRREGD